MSRFHATFWGRSDQLARLSWLGRTRYDVSAATLRRAADAWHTLREQERFAAALDLRTVRWIEDLLSCLDALPPLMQALPLTLCHGDCHGGNLLQDTDGVWVWADWQEALLGCGPADLSFFFQRASFAGAAIPYEDAVAAYHAHLEEATGLRIPPASIWRALEIADLWSRLLEWPSYLAWASPPQLDGMFQRIRLLAGRLSLAR